MTKEALVDRGRSMEKVKKKVKKFMFKSVGISKSLGKNVQGKMLELWGI